MQISSTAQRNAYFSPKKLSNPSSGFESYSVWGIPNSAGTSFNGTSFNLDSTRSTVAPLSASKLGFGEPIKRSKSLDQIQQPRNFPSLYDASLTPVIGNLGVQESALIADVTDRASLDLPRDRREDSKSDETADWDPFFNDLDESSSPDEHSSARLSSCDKSIRDSINDYL